MKPILLNDCGPEVSHLLSGLLGEKTQFMSERFEEDRRLDEYRMVVLETRADQKQVLDQISKMRYACNFRNVPIIVMRGKRGPFPHTLLHHGRCDGGVVSERSTGCMPPDSPGVPDSRQKPFESGDGISQTVHR